MERLKNFLENVFLWRSPEKILWRPFFFWRALALVSLVLGLGLEHSCPWPREVCPREGCPWPWPRIFFCVLVLGLVLEPCVLDSTSAVYQFNDFTYKEQFYCYSCDNKLVCLVAYKSFSAQKKSYFFGVSKLFIKQIFIFFIFYFLLFIFYFYFLFFLVFCIQLLDQLFLTSIFMAVYNCTFCT